MQSKFTKNKPNKFSNGAARARCAGHESAFKFVKLEEIILFYFLFSMHDFWLAKGTLKIIINYTI